uniref:Pre-rRNA-processing protein TSR2 homolog n=1 Tax=Ditylenchus dipsaci TaxID=166011 RepID=A0A915EGY6_9BILA
MASSTDGGGNRLQPSDGRFSAWCGIITGMAEEVADASAKDIRKKIAEFLNEVEISDSDALVMEWEESSEEAARSGDQLMTFLRSIQDALWYANGFNSDMDDVEESDDSDIELEE